MSPHAPSIVLISACLVLTGCDPKSPPNAANKVTPQVDARALGAQALPDWRGSASLRSSLRDAGIDVPNLSLLLTRKGREFPGFRVSADDAVRLWEQLRAATEKTGWYPLIVRDDHGMLIDWADADLPGSPEIELEAAADIDVSAWFESKRVGLEGDSDARLPRSPGAIAEPMHEPSVLQEISGTPARNLFLILIPTRDGCEFPALLMYGDWNACPAPREHVAILQHWRDKFGAEPIALGGDTIELRVPKPLDAAASMTVAEEQFLYCPDIVDQGVGSIDALASTLRAGKYWFFWWD